MLTLVTLDIIMKFGSNLTRFNEAYEVHQCVEVTLDAELNLYKTLQGFLSVLFYLGKSDKLYIHTVGASFALKHSSRRRILQFKKNSVSSFYAVNPKQ